MEMILLESLTSSESVSGLDDTMDLSLEDVRHLEIDMVQTLFGKDAAFEYICIASNNSGVDMNQLSSKFDIKMKEEHSTTTSIETMNFAGEDQRAVYQQQKNALDSCCFYCSCCSSPKVFPKNTSPYSQYSVSIFIKVCFTCVCARACVLINANTLYPRFII